MFCRLLQQLRPILSRKFVTDEDFIDLAFLDSPPRRIMGVNENSHAQGAVNNAGAGYARPRCRS
jgi:hypothetical protein